MTNSVREYSNELGKAPSMVTMVLIIAAFHTVADIVQSVRSLRD